LQSDIERTRHDVARTIDQLAAKLEVRTRLRRRLERAKADATRSLQGMREHAADAAARRDTRSVGIAVGVVAILSTTLLLTTLRRRHTPKWRR
jgi:hypothetical protein